MRSKKKFDSSISANKPKKPIVDIFELEHALVSSRVGVIKEIQRIPKDVLEPELPFLYGALLSNFTYQKDTNRSFISGAGKGLTPNEAKARALGEAVERYCGSQFDAENIVVAKYAELKDAINPLDLVLYL